MPSFGTVPIFGLIQMEIRELTDQDHEVLGVEYCSGFTDVYGKWNTGFYCPNIGNGETTYCCGTVTNKYCCTRKDQQTQQSTAGLSQAVILGSVLGSLLVFVLVSVVSFLMCRKCLPYRRSHTSLGGGPLYSMQCSSTASGVANMYSFSCQSSVAATPHDGVSDPCSVLVDLNAASREMESASNGPFPPHRGVSMLPSDPPPPYHESRSQPSNFRLRDPDTIQHTTTSFTSHRQTGSPPDRPPEAPSTRHLTNSQDSLYWSTKF